MAYTTDAALLQDVRDAIQALIVGRVKAYRIADRNFTYNELGELRAIEKDLVTRVALADTGGVGVVSFNGAQ